MWKSMIDALHNLYLCEQQCVQFSWPILQTIAGLHDEIEKKEASHKKELKEGKIVIKDLTNIIGGKNEVEPFFPIEVYPV